MSSRLQRWRVPAGFLLGAIFILLSRPNPHSLALGLPLAALGLGLRAAAAGHIRKNDVLATTGPYRYTRNPLYLGSTILGLGLVIAADRWLLALLAAGALIGIYLPVIRTEEEYLRARFGAAFDAYAARVPRLLPRMWGAKAGEAGGFSLALYRRHREYQALLGFVALTLVLLAKWHFPLLAARPWTW